MKKTTIIGFVVVLVVASMLLWEFYKHWEDAKLTRQITGTWTRGPFTSWIKDSFISTEKPLFSRTMSSNGSFTTSIGQSNDLLTYQGTWRVIDQVLVTTVTNALGSKTHEAGPVGKVERCKIIHVDNHQLDYETTSGEKITLNH